MACENTIQDIKDTKMLEKAGLKMKAISLLKVIQQNPYQNPPQPNYSDYLRRVMEREIKKSVYAI